MFRSLACLTVLAVAVSPLAAQTSQQGEPVRLVLRPAAPPRPALKYLLLPDRVAQESGNAATYYYRGEALIADNGGLVRDVKEGPWAAWSVMPLDQLPLDEVRDRLETVAPLLREADEAARRRECDWQLSDRPEAAELLLPELQGFRGLASILAVRVRYETARGHIPEAIEALQSGFALARNLNEGPTLIHVLVGAAIARIIAAQLETLLQQPDCPNLYWALVALPRPLFDPQVALQQEGTFADRQWPWLTRLEDGPLTPAEVRACGEQIEKTLKVFRLPSPSLQARVGAALLEVWDYTEAQHGLLRDGRTAEQLDAMPPFQVRALYAIREFHRAWQDYVKWFRLPQGWDDPGARADFNRLAQADLRLCRVVLPGVNSGVAPALQNVYRALGRTERRLAALRCVEAVRLYAAGHDGRLPEKLADVTDVPVPPDPVTGKPFEYEARGDSAKLAAPLLPGEKPLEPTTLTYEMTMRR